MNCSKNSKSSRKNICENKFADVKITADNSWACPRIESLLDAKLIAPNINFKPMSNVSQAEALGFILNAIYREEYNNSKDSSLSWEENAINFAKQKNILREDILSYTDEAQRAFIFKIIYYSLLLQDGNVTVEKKVEPEKIEINYRYQDRVSKAAVNWLNRNKGVHKNEAELLAASKRENSQDVHNKIGNMINNGEYNMRYKTKESGTRTVERSDGISNEARGDIMRAEYIASITGPIKNLRKQGVTDTQIINVFKREYGENSNMTKNAIYYIETGKTDFTFQR